MAVPSTSSRAPSHNLQQQRSLSDFSNRIVPHQQAAYHDRRQYMPPTIVVSDTSQLPSSGYDSHSPPSPLLHTRFRNSTATEASVNTQYINQGYDHERISDDGDSVYSTDTARNYQSQVFKPGAAGPSSSSADGRGYYDRDSWQTSSTTRPDSNVDPFAFRQYESPRIPLPNIIISSPPPSAQGSYSFPGPETPSYTPVTPPPVPRAQGRVPSVLPPNSNFSRPNLPPTISSPELDEQKRQVLERNAHRTMSTTSSIPSPQSLHRTASTPGAAVQAQSGSTIPRSASDWNVGARFKSGNASDDIAGPSKSSSPPSASLPSTPQSLKADYFSPQSPSQKPSMSTPTASTFSPVSPRNPVSIPTGLPTMRSSTPDSVYSAYSYYPLDSNTPSPSASVTRFPSENSVDERRNGAVALQQDSRSPSGKTMTPEEYLQLGITHHEANRLKESAYCFEKSATENGGCGVGMLMWGLSLRHAWGCEKDEARAFRWLKRAAEHAVEDIQSAKEGHDALKTELVLAVYEVGQCFFQGWGVPRDQKMAVSYFQTAAKLGDADAQQELAFCLANGKGCKKDRKAAAKWYRAAAAQGASTVGLAWIYKPKYSE